MINKSYSGDRRSVKELIHIWAQLHEKGSYGDIDLSKVISDSWNRCKKMGINRFMKTNTHTLDKEEFEKRKADNQTLIEEATISMESLCAFTEGSGFAFVLTDGDGIILKRVGDKEELDFLARSNLIESSDWSEHAIGTNAVGLTLETSQPTQVFGYEHYCKCAINSTCSAAPIYDRSSNIIGVLDITGPFHLVNRHTLGMAVGSAHAIERQLFLRETFKKLETLNIYKNHVLDSVSEGVVTIDNNYRVSLINRSASNQLGLDDHTSIGQKLQDLIPSGNEHFFEKIGLNKRLNSESLNIKTIKGLMKFAVTTYYLVEEKQQMGLVIILQTMKQYKSIIKRVTGMRATTTFDDIIGESVAIKGAIEIAKMSAQSKSNVLLLGETGTGKDLFAQSIHNASTRRDEPFFAINCAALPRELLSSELFGYEEGAFTGARKGGNPGKFELADQGTIFLDEISELPHDMQGSLLRVFEEGSVMRLGGNRVIPIDVRIVVATNKNLLEEVKMGNFRLDLYHRLGVIILEIPPLRKRKEDIPRLADHFIDIIGHKLGKQPKSIKPKLMDSLLKYDWPGNVRELQNFIERYINTETDGTFNIHYLLPPLSKRNAYHNDIPLLEEALTAQEMEAQLIEKYLTQFNNKSMVAKKLGIARSSLYRKMEKYKIVE